MKLIELAPGDFIVHYYMGRSYYSDQKFALAEQEFRKVLELNPLSVKGYENLGLSLEALGREEEAVQSYQKAVELNEQQQGNAGFPGIEPRRKAKGTQAQRVNRTPMPALRSLEKLRMVNFELWDGGRQTRDALVARQRLPTFEFSDNFPSFADMAFSAMSDNHLEGLPSLSREGLDFG